MASLNQAKVIKALEKAVDGPCGDFIYGFLRAYGTAASTVKRIQLGDRQRNLASIPGDIAIRDQLYFRAVPAGSELQAAADEIRALPVMRSGRIRFILVTDFRNVVGVDLKV
ncbi:MAG: class I SAM-dependent DNA methyltransferase, partial [Deltaproteobacteria bacterium]|nr:class I SAM-dependent DNA methyltransferase [Deltaproteobacteria bacterium]